MRRIFGRRGLERDVREEMEAHQAHRAEALMEEGLDQEEAWRVAREEFGDLERFHRQTLEVTRVARRRTEWRDLLDRWGQDVKLAVRQLRRSPGFAAVAVGTLGIGVAATSTLVSVVQAVVLEPLPFGEPDRLVFVEEVTPAGEGFSVSEPTYLDWADQAPVFEAVGAMGWESATLEGRGAPAALTRGTASASFLPTLGVTPLLGRGIFPEEDLPGSAARVTVLGHALWQDAFGGDPGVVGTEVILSGEAYRVVGVLPPDIPYLEEADLLVPLGADPGVDRGDHYLDVLARLAPGVEVDAARREMTAVATRLGEIHPVDRGWGARVTTVRDALVGPELTRAGWVLLAGAALLLLIACVNVSNLLLARATVRRPEVAVRVALGAGKGRLVRQLLTESGVLAVLGGGLGLALTAAALPAVKAMGGAWMPRLDQATIGLEVLASSIAAAAVAALISGLTPAFELRGDGPAGMLRGTARGRTEDGRRLRRALVAAQLALSLALLVGTALLARSLQELGAVETGFDTDGRLAVRFSIPPERYDRDRRVVMMEELVDAVEAVPGVRRAGGSAVDPFSQSNLMNFAAREDRMPDDAREFLSIAWRPVTPGFADAMGMELLAGRPLERSDGWAEDDAGTPVLVSRSLVERLWPTGTALGEVVGGRLVWGDPQGSRLRIVGVVSDIRDWRITEEPFPTIFRPYSQIPWTVMTLVVRAEGGEGAAAGLAGPVRRALRSAAPDLAIPDPGPLAATVRRATARPRFHARLLAIFAAAGLGLAAVGVYGVTAFGVSRRFREIGIRMAVGGDPEAIRGMVLRDALRTTLAGLVVGLVLGWAVARGVASLLYRTDALDPVSWIGGVCVLLIVSVAAAWIPARRATRVDPRVALAE